jgi:hypothetical protein
MADCSRHAGRIPIDKAVSIATRRPTPYDFGNRDDGIAVAPAR